MAEFTENLNLEMPDKTEQYNVAVQNSNMKKIDDFSKLIPPRALTADKLTTGANINNVFFDGTQDIEIETGGGLEIGDIGIAPLGIDETQGKRRYLNGQIIIQDQYAIFSEKVKNAINLYPTLGCTEQEWQTIATMSVGGQVGKFVVDNEGGTIRLPKVVNINGLRDLALMGSIKSESLPNITGSFVGGKLTDGVTNVSGALYNYGGNTNIPSGGTSGSSMGIGFDASRSSSIYQDNAPVQQEAIQYPYFIQVATGSETEDNIVNTIELNNPFVLLEPKFFESEVYNVSWLLANGSYNGSNAVHSSAYQALLVENNAEIATGSTVTLPIGTEYTKRGLSVKLSTDSDITDYDFVVNTSDETFRLPIKVNLASGKAVVGNGEQIGVNIGGQEGTLEGGVIVNVSDYQNYVTIKTENAVLENNLPISLTTDPTKSGLELSDSNLYLYFYVGETVQNANLINAGRIEEKLADCLTRNNKEEIISWGMPDYSAGFTLLTNTVHTAEFDMLCIHKRDFSSPGGDDQFYIYEDDGATLIIHLEWRSFGGNYGMRTSSETIIIPKGTKFKFSSGSFTFYPLKGAK